MAVIRPVILHVSASGAELARQLASALDGDVTDTVTDLPAHFAAGRPIVGVCAAGILIRTLAPSLAAKQGEPPVVAVSADGHHVVPLLGGHHGANVLAERIAAITGGTAALTTASASRFARGLDEPPRGWVLADPAAAKPAMAAILAGKAIALDGNAPWLAEAGYPIDPAGTVHVTVTDRTGGTGLVYHPRTLVAGIGCERGTSTAEIIALVRATLAQAGLAASSLAALASIDIKSDEPGLLAAATEFGVPLRLFTAAELAAERNRLPNPSAIVEAETGTPGVAEAAALKAGSLAVDKRKSARATCAIGRAPRPIDPTTLGRPVGSLHIVGIGPGAPDQRTAAATAALRATSDWVGYGLYLDLIADLRRDQVEHRFPLGEEEVRVRHALELAGQGRSVALISSGDAQIYAMAALVFELLEATGPRALSPAARRVAIATHPGISALQAASAAAGALLGHDFCAVSLSDLLTPHGTVLQRIEAAATGDFVTALYNPRSQRRTDLLDAALAIFRAHRPADCPVIVARSLGRPDQQVRVVRLDAFDPAEVDMLTIVLIGATASRAFMRRDGTTLAYTPRGYAQKAEAAE